MDCQESFTHLEFPDKTSSCVNDMIGNALHNKTLGKVQKDLRSERFTSALTIMMALLCFAEAWSTQQTSHAAGLSPFAISFGVPSLRLSSENWRQDETSKFCRSVISVSTLQSESLPFTTLHISSLSFTNLKQAGCLASSPAGPPGGFGGGGDGMNLSCRAATWSEVGM